VLITKLKKALKIHCKANLENDKIMRVFLRNFEDPLKIRISKKKLEINPEGSICSRKIHQIKTTRKEPKKKERE
jgi:hypothetical protein